MFMPLLELSPTRISYDFFLRAGGGVSVRVSGSYWVESAFHFSHISNGLGFGADNPTWNGRGLLLGIRRTFRPHEHTKRNATPAHEETAEKAWTTSAEEYWAAPGSNLQNPKIHHEMRALRISHTWPFQGKFEFQLGA